MMQRKSKLVLAVLSTLALPGVAWAEADADDTKAGNLKGVVSGIELQVYGKLYPEFVTVSQDGATAAAAKSAATLGAAPTGVNTPNRNEINSSNSRIGIRGEKNLGGGIKAMAQVEYKLSVDNSGTSPGTNLSSRDTWVGVGSGFGTVKLGNMDTVYKQIGDTLSFLGVSSGNFVTNSNIIAKGGFGSSSASSFHLRRANVVVYESPTIGGFQFLGMYGPDEAKDVGRNADLVSYGVTFTGVKNLYLALSHEEHNDLFGGSKNVASSLSNSSNLAAHSKDTSTRGTVQYKFGSTTAELNVATTELSESGGTVGKFAGYKHDSWSLGVAQKFGKWNAAVQFSNAAAGSCTLIGGAACSTTGMEGKQIALGGSYDFPEASIFVMYAKVVNGASAQYDNRENNSPTLAAGADISQLAVGVNFKF